MFTVKTTIETLEVLSKKLDTERRFTFTRFGDGEIMMMEGWEGYEKNQFNSDELQAELLEAIQTENDNYLIGLGCGQEQEKKMKEGVFGAFRKDEDLCRAIISNSKKEVFLNLNVLPYLALYRKDIFDPFWDKVRSKKIMFVSGKHLKDIRADYYVETPVSQAYGSIDTIYDEIVKNIKNVEIVMFSVGISTVPIQKRLWDDGYEVASLDIGSFFDGVLGLQSRQWIKETDIELLKKYL